MQTTTIPLWTISQDEYKAIEKGTLLEIDGRKTFVQVENGYVGAAAYEPVGFKFACRKCGKPQKDARAKGTHEWFKHGIHGVNAKYKAKKSRKAKK